MSLRDHFHPPLHWKDLFHSNWATRIADALNDEWLPPEFLAEEQTHAGNQLEVDVATLETADAKADPSTQAARSWSPAPAPFAVAAAFPDSFEVRILADTGGLTLVAAIELISPANKDRPEHRRAFAAKCAGYLHQGVGLIIIDIVTARRANLHHDILDLMGTKASRFDDGVDLYSVAYRPVLRNERPEIDIWPEACTLGRPLPTLPLRLTGDLFVPVDFEKTYQEACRRRRIA